MKQNRIVNFYGYVKKFTKIPGIRFLGEHRAWCLVRLVKKFTKIPGIRFLGEHRANLTCLNKGVQNRRKVEKNYRKYNVSVEKMKTNKERYNKSKSKTKTYYKQRFIMKT